MSLQLQFFLIAGSLIFFFTMIRLIRKSKFAIENAIIWVIWGIGLILISIFPELVFKLTSVFGFIAPINMLYLFMIFFLYCMVFYLYLKYSILEDKLKRLVHEVALLKKEQEDKK